MIHRSKVQLETIEKRFDLSAKYCQLWMTQCACNESFTLGDRVKLKHDELNDQHVDYVGHLNTVVLLRRSKTQIIHTAERGTMPPHVEDMYSFRIVPDDEIPFDDWIRISACYDVVVKAIVQKENNEYVPAIVVGRCSVCDLRKQNGTLHEIRLTINELCDPSGLLQ